MSKKVGKYKKGSKKFNAAVRKMKRLKWKLKHAKRKKVVMNKVVKNVVVKRGGKRARKEAKKEKAKASKLTMKLAAAKQAIAAMSKRVAKYKKGSKEFNAAMLKMRLLKSQLERAKHTKVVKRIVKKVVVKRGGKRARKAARKE